jgi:arylformamidase
VSGLIDISQTLKAGIATWPGDTAFAPFWVMRLESGDSCNVGSVTMSLHTGTHADAPRHFLAGGATPAEMDPSPFIGKALVLDLAGVHTILPEHLGNLATGKTEGIERILFRTGTARADQFMGTFAHLSDSAARLLADLGVLLVGIDTPSVDSSDSRELLVHKVLAGAGIAILENLVLAHVPAGRYELIALPLKLEGMDASPVRAVLRAL